MDSSSDDFYNSSFDSDTTSDSEGPPKEMFPPKDLNVAAELGDQQPQLAEVNMK